MDLFQSFNISRSGLHANRIKMNVYAKNLANAETTRTPEGGPYRREMVVFEPVALRNPGQTPCDKDENNYYGVAVTEIVKSQDDFSLVYNPSHPDADPVTGYVAMPNIDPMTELSNMIVARRAYDANVAAMSTTKSMILKALEIGK